MGVQRDSCHSQDRIGRYLRGNAQGRRERAWRALVVSLELLGLPSRGGAKSLRRSNCRFVWFARRKRTERLDGLSGEGPSYSPRKKKRTGILRLLPRQLVRLSRGFPYGVSHGGDL